jgi:hypothetical protein
VKELLPPAVIPDCVRAQVRVPPTCVHVPVTLVLVGKVGVDVEPLPHEAAKSAARSASKRRGVIRDFRFDALDRPHPTPYQTPSSEICLAIHIFWRRMVFSVAGG